MPMRVLIDECLPRKLKLEFPEHDTKTVPEMGWSGKKNGKLLQLMTGQFDVFITIDRNLTSQQNLENTKLGVIKLTAPSNRLADLLPLVPKIKTILDTIEPGTVVRIEAE
jgi:hypothetical protein